MNELRRLINLVVKRSAKSYPLINQQEDNNLETKLFNLIKQGNVANDEEAALVLYGNRRLSANYRVLKSRMRKKLLNHLHFIEFPSDRFSLYSVENYKLHASLLEAQALITANEYKLADKILTQALATAKENCLTASIVKALEKKLTIHSTIINKKEYLKADEELQYYYIIENHERSASRLFELATVELSSSVGERSSYLPKVPEILQEIYAHWLSTKSPLIYNGYHILSIHYLELLGDFKAISEAVKQAEKLLEQGILHKNWFNKKYNAFIRVYALLRTGEYEAGLSLAKSYLQLFDPQTINWFAFMENYLLLALYSKQYVLAGEVLQKSLSNNFFREIRVEAKERWELYRRHLLLMNDELPVKLQVELPKNFFVELVTLPKDKAGFNLSILILDIIKSFSSTSTDSYEPQAERLKKYIVKYLRGEKAERARLFLRLLLVAIKKELDFVKTNEAGLKLYENMSQTPPPGDAFAEVEVIPYEHLWEAVLCILKHRKSIE